MAIHALDSGILHGTSGTLGLFPGVTIETDISTGRRRHYSGRMKTVYSMGQIFVGHLGSDGTGP